MTRTPFGTENAVGVHDVVFIRVHMIRLCTWIELNRKRMGYLFGCTDHILYRF